MAKEPPRPRPTASCGAASDPEGVRLNRFLASCGYGSRRKCEAFITEGRVEVNGEVAVDLATRVSPADHVRVDGKIVRPEQELTLLLNKPRGYLTTRDDPEERKTIYDLLPRKFRNLSYVGRLDQESQGLLLLTNSGSLNEALTHPRHRIEKEYLVALDRAFDPELIPRLTEGIHLAEGLARAESVRPLSRRRLSVVLTQGYNRQIRRMFAKLDYKVKELERVRIGRLRAPDLSTGDFRVLNRRDLAELSRNP
ncbi:MAG: rRNA pseudouridine synthase [Verrucomicrobiae bacterium]|nr:rRNA pseudouridine synthase [Verrucomicrobiae bacterium]